MTSNLDEMGLRYASRTFTEQKNIYCKNISILVIASFSAKQSMGLMQLSLKFIPRKPTDCFVPRNDKHTAKKRLSGTHNFTLKTIAFIEKH